MLSLFPFLDNWLLNTLNHFIYCPVVKYQGEYKNCMKLLSGRFCEEMMDLLSGHMTFLFCLSCYEFYMSIFVQIESF
jgi:hypothetical protein